MNLASVFNKHRLLWEMFVVAALLVAPAAARAGDAIHLGVSDRRLDAFFDMPWSYHQVPQTNVMLSGKVKKGNEAEVDKALSIDVNGISRRVLVDYFGGKEVKEGFTISPDSDGDSLSITPWVLLQKLDDGEVKEWTVWNVQYWDLYWDQKKWEGVCFAGLSEPRPLEGKGGWTSNGGEFLKEAVRADTRELLACSMRELKGDYKKVKFQHSKLKAVWASEKKSKQITAQYIEADPGVLLIYKYDDPFLFEFMDVSMAGALLKSIFPNSVLFNGSLLLPSNEVEMAPENPRPNPPPPPSQGISSSAADKKPQAH